MRRAKLRMTRKWSSASAVPHVATARGTPPRKNPMTSVYPSQTTTSPDVMSSDFAQLRP